MKEQIQVPFDNKGEDQEKGSSPKELSKPMMPKGLERPKISRVDELRELIHYQRCSCGNPRCNSPQGDSDWFWVYYDKDGKHVEDPSLPMNGPRKLPSGSFNNPDRSNRRPLRDDSLPDPFKDMPRCYER
jgi:hypothetical protein